MFWPCETRTSTCRSFATISSGLYRFLAIAVLLDVKDIPQAGPLQWGWITDPTHTITRRMLPGVPSSVRKLARNVRSCREDTGRDGQGRDHRKSPLHATVPTSET